MTAAPRPRRTSTPGLLTILFVWSPVLVPAVVVLGVLVLLLVLMVIQDFEQSIAQGLVALGTLIGLPWLGLIWLKALLRVAGVGSTPSTPSTPPAPQMPGLAETEARYRAGDFIHRDYEAEKRAWEAEKQAWEEEAARGDQRPEPDRP